jgi:hypothetical protein
MLDFPGTRDARVLIEAAGRMNGIGASPKGAFRKAVPQDLSQDLHHESCGLIKFSLQLLHCRKPHQLTIPRRLDICLHGYVALAAIVVRNRSRKNALKNVACPKGGPLKILDLQTKSAAIYDGSALLLSRRCCPGPTSVLPGATIRCRPIRAR